MPGRDAALAATVHHWVHRDDLALFEDADLVGRAVHLDRAAPGRVGDAVEIAVDRHHAVLGDPALQPQHCLEWPGGQRFQPGPLLGEVLADDPARGGVSADVGDLVEPLAELRVEVGAVAEAAAEE